jgi:hypothetical protein
MRSDIHAKPPKELKRFPHTIERGLVNAARVGSVGPLRQKRLGASDPMLVVLKAREYTVEAIKTLVSLMKGEVPAGSDAQGVPPAVQLRAAELLIERGYGKSPQAILLRDDTAANATSAHSVPILERIAQIKAAQDTMGQTTDLEASEAVLVEEEADFTETSATSPDPQKDII